MKRKRTLACLIALLFVAGEVVAQVAKRPHSILRDFSMNIPLDGGTFLLMAAGIIYGGTVLSKD